MRRFWSLMVLTVREIFDESAYTRFLARRVRWCAHGNRMRRSCESMGR